MRQLANRQESRHRAESVLNRQFGPAAVGITRQSLAEDLLFALDELDSVVGQSWHVFDKDDPTTWPREVGRYVVATAWPDEDNEGEIDRDWDRDTWWCYFGADKPPVGHWQEFQSEAVTHWMEISVPPAPVSKEDS